MKFQVVFTVSSYVGNIAHKVSSRLYNLISCWQPCTWSFRSSYGLISCWQPCTWSFRSSSGSHLVLATLYMEFQVVFTVSSLVGNSVHEVSGRLYGLISCWQPCTWSFRSSLRSHVLLATLYMEFQVFFTVSCLVGNLVHGVMINIKVMGTC